MRPFVQHRCREGNSIPRSALGVEMDKQKCQRIAARVVKSVIAAEGGLTPFPFGSEDQEQIDAWDNSRHQFLKDTLGNAFGHDTLDVDQQHDDHNYYVDHPDDDSVRKVMQTLHNEDAGVELMESSEGYPYLNVSGAHML